MSLSSRLNPPPGTESGSRRRTGGGAAFLVPAVILLVAVALLAVSIVAGGRDDDAATPGQDVTKAGTAGAAQAPAAEVVAPEEQPTLDMARRESGDPLAVGPVDAPVTLVVYSDYQCPYCASWATDTGPVMLEYALAGDLRIEYRDIAIFGEESHRAALAAYAAGLQGHYLDYHHALFPGGDKLPPRGLRAPALIELAGEVGLDADRFAADLDSPEATAAVQRNIDEAAAIGAFSTPAFLLADSPILGAQPTEVFVGALEAALRDGP